MKYLDKKFPFSFPAVMDLKQETCQGYLPAFMYTIYLHTYLLTFLPSCLHIYLTTYQRTNIPTVQSYLLYLPANCTYLQCRSDDIPTNLPTYIHKYIPSYLSIFILTYIYIPAYLNIYLPTCLQHISNKLCSVKTDTKIRKFEKLHM
jgi:hypothetical protein